MLVLAKADLPDGTLPCLQKGFVGVCNLTRQQLNGKPEISTGHQQLTRMGIGMCAGFWFSPLDGWFIALQNQALAHDYGAVVRIDQPVPSRVGGRVTAFAMTRPTGRTNNKNKNRTTQVIGKAALQEFETLHLL